MLFIYGIEIVTLLLYCRCHFKTLISIYGKFKRYNEWLSKILRLERNILNISYIGKFREQYVMSIIESCLRVVLKLMIDYMYDNSFTSQIFLQTWNKSYHQASMMTKQKHVWKHISKGFRSYYPDIHTPSWMTRQRTDNWQILLCLTL